jgi:hypothetical protein
VKKLVAALALALRAAVALAHGHFCVAASSTGVATRGITIDAPPSDVWPWLAQVGPHPRGGVYTFDWIENLLGLTRRISRSRFRLPALEIGSG